MTAGDIRQRVLGIQTDRKPVPLDFTGWGEGLYVRVLSAAAYDLLAEGADPNRLPVRVLLHCLVDEDGERIFIDEDEGNLGEFPFPEIMQAFAQVAKLNGMSNAELEEAVASFTPAPDEQRSIG